MAVISGKEDMKSRDERKRWKERRAEHTTVRRQYFVHMRIFSDSRKRMLLRRLREW